MPNKEIANQPKTQILAKKHSIWAKISVIVVLLLVTILSPGGWALAYRNKIYPNVKVAGVNVGGMTVDQARAAIEIRIEELQKNGPILTYQDKVLSPSLADLGVTFDSVTAVAAAMNFGRDSSIKSKLSSYFDILVNKADVNLTSSVDQEKTKAYVAKLSSEITKPATNAGVVVVNGQVTTTPPVEGLGFDSAKILADLNNFINNPQAERTIDLELTAIEPPILAENTTQAVAQTNKYLNSAPISVTYQDKNWAANRAEIGTWMKYSIKANALIVTVSPSSFINKISKEVVIPERPRQVQDGTGTVLDEGQDGLGIDEKSLTSQIITALGGPGSAPISLPVYDIPRGQKTVYPDAMPGRYAGRYIDINLSQQKLYAFDGSALVNSFLVSTGKSGYATPTGEFHVYGKSRVTTMDGPGYYLPGVEWVSWWSGDYSIHGTYWHHNFGHTMSHGCVNASNADAEWIYNWDDIGTPVYIHY